MHEKCGRGGGLSTSGPIREGGDSFQLLRFVFFFNWGVSGQRKTSLGTRLMVGLYLKDRSTINVTSGVKTTAVA